MKVKYFKNEKDTNCKVYFSEKAECCYNISKNKDFQEVFYINNLRHYDFSNLDVVSFGK